MFPFVLGLSSILAASALNSVSYSYLKVVPSETSLVAGERFSVDILAFAHVPVNAVDVTVAFSSEAIEVTGVDTGRSVITLWTEEPEVRGSQVVLRGGTYQRGFRGEHLIATITAVAKQSGDAEFLVRDITLLAGDGRGTPVLTGSPEQSRARIVVADTEGTPGNLKAAVEVAVVTDINGDGRVSLGDVSAFLAAWHGRSAVYDFNNDGKMTFRDFGIILADSFFGTTNQ
jgi:hypothetical protein